MSLSQELGYKAPNNHVLLPNDRYRRIFDRDFTIREVYCDNCKTVLCALVIAEEHEADLVWPHDVLCGESHLIVPKGTPGAAKVCCKGRAAQEWEAREYLKKYI